MVLPTFYQPSTYETNLGGYTQLDTANLNQLYNDVKQDREIIWAREDSAYQRMVADMKKAGLNPWTGISSGGLSTSSVSPTSDAMSSMLGALNYVHSVNSLSQKAGDDLSKNLIKVFGLLTGFMANVRG